MNNGVLIQSLLIGFSLVCVKPFVKNLNIKNKFVIHGSSFSFFWGLISIISIFSIIIEKYLHIDLYNPYFIFFIVLAFCQLLNNSSKRKYKFKQKDFFIFIFTTLITYISSYLNIPRIRGGDGYWLVQTAYSLANNNLNIGDFAGAGHRAPLWILLESFSLMASNYLLFNFQILSAFLVLMILISEIYDRYRNRNEKIISTLFILTLITSPAYIALSIYFEIHTFVSLLIILLWYFLDKSKQLTSNYLLNSTLLLLLCSTLSLSRFEGFLLAAPFLYRFIQIEKKLVNLKTYFVLFTLNSFWYFNLININISHKSSSEYIFLIVALLPHLSLLIFYLIRKVLSFKNLLIIEILIIIILLLSSSQFREICTTFFNIINFYGVWGAAGPLFLIIIFYLIFQFIKKSFSRELIQNENISIILILGLQLLTFFGNTTLGWRYGLSSSANRLFYMILPILILDFYKEYKST